MSDQTPVSKLRWAAIIAVIAIFLFSLTKCSGPTPSSRTMISSAPSKSQSPPRQIDPEQREKLKVLLAPFTGSGIIFVGTPGDDESQAFAMQLDSIFREAGWKTELRSTTSAEVMPSVFLRVPKSHVPEAKAKEFSASASDVVLSANDLPLADVAVLKALAVLKMDCPLETMDGGNDTVELRIGHRP